MKNTQGARAYIGCCCDAFQLKRQEAFKKAGLPGLLIDIENTTCYDLNQEKAAYKGGFENQTHLRLDLLEKVLRLSEKIKREGLGGFAEVDSNKTYSENSSLTFEKENL